MRQFRELTALHVGEVVMLRVPANEHPRGSLVRIARVIEGGESLAYVVEPLADERDENGAWTLAAHGAPLTLEAADLAHSLPDFQTGPSSPAAAVVQQVVDLLTGRRPPTR